MGDPFVVIAAAVVLLPTIAAAISGLRHPWMPSGDWALIELQVRDVGTADTPLVGVYSRYPWRHPGPWPFYLLALPYRLVPADRGLLFAAAVVNLGAVLGFVLLMIRRPRLQALCALLGLAVVQRGLGIKELGDPWNPTLPVMPFALFMAVCFEHATTRKRWTLPAMAALASFVVQAHVGFAHPVLFVGGAAIGLRWWQNRQASEAGPEVALEARAVGAAVAKLEDDVEDETAAAPEAEPAAPRRWRRVAARSWVWTVAVLLVAWAPPLWDQFFQRGNLGKLISWSFGDDSGANEYTSGHPGGLHRTEWASWLLDPTGLWVGRFRPIQVFGVPLFGLGTPWKLVWLPLVIGGTAAIVLWRRKRALQDSAWSRSTLALSALGAAGLVATGTGLLTVRGVPVFHPFRWVVVVVMVLWVAVGWALVGRVKERLPWIDGDADGQARDRSHRLGSALVASALVAAVFVPVAATLWNGSLGRRPGDRDVSIALLRLRDDIEKYADEEATEVLVVESDNGYNVETLGLAVIVDRAGIAWVEPDDPRAIGHRRLDIAGAHELDGLLGYAINMGSAKVLAWSGDPRPGDGPFSELILIRSAEIEELRPPSEGTLD